jgi:hypothetical protein
MDGQRFDDLTRRLVVRGSRRWAFRGLLGVASAVWTGGWETASAVACRSDEKYRGGFGCVCLTTGRPPTPPGSRCPCPSGQQRCGDACVRIDRDPANCGECGRHCPVDRPYCVGAACVACRRDADCDDGIGCTVDVCRGGACLNTPDQAFCDDGNPCTIDACDPDAGCTTIENDGATCEDGDLCTTGDVCQAGVCRRGVPVDCLDLTDACNDGVCDPSTGDCFVRPAREGQRCDPGDRCVEDASCRAGRCVGVPVNCDHLSGDCASGFCDAATGKCDADAINDGEPCTPDFGCFTDATCLAGSCLGEPLDCSLLDQECARGSCDDESGTCRLRPVANGTACGAGGTCCAGSCCSDACSVSGECPTCMPSGSVGCRDDDDCCGNLGCGGTYPLSVCRCVDENHGPCNQDSDCCGDLVCFQDESGRTSCVGNGRVDALTAQSVFVATAWKVGSLR